MTHPVTRARRAIALRRVPLPPFARRLSALGLGLWVIGAQALELVASIGLALTAVAGLWVLALDVPLRRRLLVATAPLLAWVGLAAVVPWLAGHPPTATGFARAIDWLGVPLGAAAWVACDERQRRSVAWAAGVTLAVSCLFALVQWLGVLPPESFFDSLAWTKIPFGRAYEPMPGSPGRFMGGGLQFHRLKFAHVTGVVVLAALATRTREGVALAVAGVASVWLFTAARGASVALLVAVAVAAVLLLGHAKRALLAVGALVLAGVVALAASSGLRARLTDGVLGADGSDRARLLQSGLTAIREHPVTGVGLGQFHPGHFAPQGVDKSFFENWGKAHNQLVSFAAESGVPVTLLFVVALVLLARRSEHRTLAVPALVFFALLGLAHDPLFQAPFSMALVAALGVALGATREPPSAFAGRSATSPRSPG